jgi:hypothetical protein
MLQRRGLRLRRAMQAKSRYGSLKSRKCELEAEMQARAEMKRGAEMEGQSRGAG